MLEFWTGTINKKWKKIEEKIKEIWGIKYNEGKKSEEEVTQWSADLEENIAKTVTPSEVIKRAVEKFQNETENYAVYLQDKEDEKRMQRRLEEERRNQKMNKAEMKKLKKTKEVRGSRGEEVRVKLPKLVTQFEVRI